MLDTWLATVPIDSAVKTGVVCLHVAHQAARSTTIMRTSCRNWEAVREILQTRAGRLASIKAVRMGMPLLIASLGRPTVPRASFPRGRREGVLSVLVPRPRGQAGKAVKVGKVGMEAGKAGMEDTEVVPLLGPLRHGEASLRATRLRGKDSSSRVVTVVVAMVVVEGTATATAATTISKHRRLLRQALMTTTGLRRLHPRLLGLGRTIKLRRLRLRLRRKRLTARTALLRLLVPRLATVRKPEQLWDRLHSCNGRCCLIRLLSDGGWGRKAWVP